MESQLTDYSIEKVIREEFLGTLYQAIHLPSNKTVTIRLINPSLIDDVFYERLVTKCKVLTNLNHPAIGKFYSYAIQGDRLYLISEFISGYSLQEYVAAFQNTLAEEKIWDLFIRLVEAFAFAHKQGVNHFSIHPLNIYITAEEDIKVLNFGIAGLFSDYSPGLVKEWYKLQYMSPEQINGYIPDERSDIYSLGIILFELITQQTPYPSVLSESTVKDKIINHSLPPIQLYTKIFTQSYTMQALLDKATAKNPAYRFEDFEALKENLLEIKDEQETMLISQLMIEVNQKSQQFGSGNNSTIELARQKIKRKRIGQAFLILGMMAGAIVIGLNITIPSADNGQPLLTDQESKPAKGDTVDIPGENDALTQQLETHKSTDQPVEGQKKTADRKKGTKSNKVASSAAKVKGQIPANTISHAGFSLEASPEQSFLYMQLQSRLEDFYAVLRSKDLSQTHNYYAPVLTRFFNEKNVHEKQLQDLLQKAWQRTPEDRHQILWDTFHYYQDEQGNYIMDFYMNYTYHRANRKAWRSQRIHTIIKMNKDLKIFYMAGD